LKDEDYIHETVNHKYHFVQLVEHTANILNERGRKVQNNIPWFDVKKEHYISYLAEFMFKRRFDFHKY